MVVALLVHPVHWREADVGVIRVLSLRYFRRQCGQVSDVVNLVPSLSNSLNPVVSESGNGINHINSINSSITTSNIPAYLSQIDAAKVRVESSQKVVPTSSCHQSSGLPSPMLTGGAG